jgi:hypothetical protein
MWITARAFGSQVPGQGQLQADSIEHYLSGLRSFHVDRGLPTDVFNNEHIKRLIKGARRLFPQPPKRNRLPIIKSTLIKIANAGLPLAETPLDSSSTHSFNSAVIDNINGDAAFRLAFAAFLCMGEFTYTAKEAADPTTFVATKLTRSDVRFAEDYNYLILRLKRSKTDTKHEGVSIMVAATGDRACPVAALRTLFRVDPQQPNAPLFRLNSGPFARSPVLRILAHRLELAGIQSSGYTGHSFRHGASQHAYDSGMSESDIQTLGRWTSAAFKLYFKASRSLLYRLNRQFQTGRPPPILTSLT